MNLARHSRNQKTKNKSPRTHLSQVWSPAFRLPWVRSRLKPELRTSPQRRGEREGRPWERTLPACLRFRDYYQSTQDACAPRRTPENPLQKAKDFRVSSTEQPSRNPKNETPRTHLREVEIQPSGCTAPDQAKA